MTQPLRLLFVEDSEDDALLVVRELRRGGYDVDYERVDTAQELTNALTQQTWDIVIADYTMPHLIGTEALDFLKKSGSDIPFIFVSGTIGEDTAVAAMKAGANDYVMKGNLKRLVPAVERELQEAVIRREHKQAEERLRYFAYHDVVTELPNFTFFCGRLEQAIVTARREQNRVALLIIKVNRFKEINETLGHRTADILLKQIGRRLREKLSGFHNPACLRGNEFAVLLPSLGGVDEATRATRKVLKILESPFVLEGLKLEIQAASGIALFPEHGTSAELLVQRARVALSAARKNHRDHAIYSPEQDQNGADQLTLIADLRRAIVENELSLLYQSKVNLRESSVTGMEALARWNHPGLGLIPPDRFIPLAERTGLIMPLTLWVLHEALHQHKVWSDKKLNLTMAVNLSTWNLQAEELPDQISGLLSSAEVPPSRLELEITESAIMANPELALKNVTRMKKMGLRFSIDDFGTGYSSLAYLKKFPIDEIKIDKSFVMNMAKSQEDVVIVHSIIDLGHNLGLKVVAEGVEDRESMDLLTKLGCDEAQGYYFSRPLPPGEVPERLMAIARFLTEGGSGISNKITENPKEHADK